MSAAPVHPDYEVVIGLETHVHMKTRTKLFCGCTLAYGDEPNHHTCPVCLALPGALPVPNREALELSIRVGCALGSRIPARRSFVRRSASHPTRITGSSTAVMRVVKARPKAALAASTVIARGRLLPMTKSHAASRKANWSRPRTGSGGHANAG